VRELSRQFHLPTWDKPALACLSSRIPHGTPITLQSLSQVDRAEMFLKSLGVGQVRVRHHGNTARIEVEPGDFSLLHNHRLNIEARLATIGFLHVEIDPQGYHPASGVGPSATASNVPYDGETASLIRSLPLPVLTSRDNAS